MLRYPKNYSWNKLLFKNIQFWLLFSIVLFLSLTHRWKGFALHSSSLLTMLMINRILSKSTDDIILLNKQRPCSQWRLGRVSRRPPPSQFHRNSLNNNHHRNCAHLSRAQSEPILCCITLFLTSQLGGVTMEDIFPLNLFNNLFINSSTFYQNDSEWPEMDFKHKFKNCNNLLAGPLPLM